MSFIPYGRQDINEADIQAVVDVLHSDFLTQGPAVPAFEQSVRDYCGAEYALAVNSATSALHIACLALGIGKGDVVWTSPVTFVASANCALYCGADVDFVDIDPRTYNMSVDQLAAKLEKAKQENRLPKIVIPVHLCGQICEMKRIHALSQQYGFHVIEDASHAIGGKHQNEPVGNCRYCDITIFGFHPIKIITTAKGNMALTNNANLGKKMALLRSHGITRESKLMIHEPEGIWYYQQIELGFNYPITDIEVALAQCSDTFVQGRHEHVKRYDQLFSKLLVTLPEKIKLIHHQVLMLCGFSEASY